MSIKFRWLGNAGFEIILPSGRVLVLDPYMDEAPNAPFKSDEITGADYIVLTHGHFDHCSDAGKLALKFNSRVICSREIAPSITDFFGLDENRVIKVSAGDVVDFDDISIEVLRSIHASTARMMKATYQRLVGEAPPPEMPLNEITKIIRELSPPRESQPDDIRTRMNAAGIAGGEQLSFIFRTSDNLRTYVYSANPEDYLRRQITEVKPNIAFIQLTARPERVAEIAALSGAEIIIPTHHDMQGPDARHKSVEEMAAALKEKSPAQVIDTEYGKWYEVGVKITPD